MTTFNWNVIPIHILCINTTFLLICMLLYCACSCKPGCVCWRIGGRFRRTEPRTVAPFWYGSSHVFVSWARIVQNIQTQLKWSKGKYCMCPPIARNVCTVLVHLVCHLMHMHTWIAPIGWQVLRCWPAHGMLFDKWWIWLPVSQSPHLPVYCWYPPSRCDSIYSACPHTECKGRPWQGAHDYS